VSLSAPAAPRRAPARHRSLREGLRIQISVVHALLLREIQTRFGRGGFGFLWLFLEPLFVASTIGLIHWARAGDSGPRGHGEIPMFLFAVVSYAPFFLFRAMVGRAVSAVPANLTLLYHQQVQPLDILLARNILDGASMLTVVAVIVGGAMWFTSFLPYDLLLLMTGLLLLLLFVNGLTLLVAAAAMRWEEVERMTPILTYLLLPFSGAFFALDWLPNDWRQMLLWFPQPHFHEMIRDGMFGNMLTTYYDLSYMLAWIGMTNLLGLCAVRAARRHLEF
jgi:capsular polysaccharide transport system permease protein